MNNDERIKRLNEAIHLARIEGYEFTEEQISEQMSFIEKDLSDEEVLAILKSEFQENSLLAAE